MNATLVHPDGWYPASWRRLPARQMPGYADAAALCAVEARLAQAAPVVASSDAGRFRIAVASLVERGGIEPVRAVAQGGSQTSPQRASGALVSVLGEPGLGAADHQLTKREVDPAAAQAVERGTNPRSFGDGVARVSRRHAESVHRGTTPVSRYAGVPGSATTAR